jgi:type IV pilus assembly protein PilV
MSQTRRPTRQRIQRGVMLLEALLGILIFSVGIIGLMGLQAASIRSASEAKYRAAAGFFANQLIGQMWVDRTNLGSYGTTTYGGRQNWEAAMQNALPGASADVQIVGSTVTVRVRWKTDPSAAQHEVVSIANINGS